MPRSGVLLVNLGTPDAPTPSAVRRYLREFLSDPWVLDISPPARWALLNLVVLPTRPRRSAEAYRQVWTEAGSPLLVHAQALADAVAAALPGVPVQLGMRYGQPDLAGALGRLRAAGADRVVVLPLYPQYAGSSTGSSLDAVYRLAARTWNVPWLHVVPPFFDDPVFLRAHVEVARPVLDGARPDHLLFSFHGLPERQVQRSHLAGTCASEGCATTLGEANRHCYVAQSHATARAIARGLDWPADRWSVSFQSRLGRTPWVRPFTDQVLPQLAAAGVRRVAVLEPSFTADCLETLEEIGIRGRNDFLAAGGEDLTLVPALNAHPVWVDAVVGLVRGSVESLAEVHVDR